MQGKERVIMMQEKDQGNKVIMMQGDSDQGNKDARIPK